MNEREKLIYFNGSEKELADLVREKVDEKRFFHIQGVVEYAKKLAVTNKVDIAKATIAAWVHDYAKQFSDGFFLEKIDEYHLGEDLKRWGNPIWHGVVGAKIVQEQLNISDGEILSAIEQHTTGDIQMSLLSQVLFMSDWLEENTRKFVGVQEAREITDNNLQDGVALQLRSSVESLAQRKKAIYPKTIDAYNSWVGGIK